MSFSSLPLELKEKILDLLDNESLLTMQQVSEDWNTSKIQKKVDICLAEKIEEEYQRSLSIVGLGKHQDQDYLLELDTKLDKWVPLTRIPSDLLEMKLDGWSPHLHTHGDKIYIVGVLHCHVAVFETKTGQWRILQAEEVTTPRWGYATAMMGPKLFCFGGQDDNGSPLDTVQVLDTEEDVKGWETVCSMSTPKMSCGVVEHGGQFYIFGGETRDEEEEEVYLASAEVFDPVCNQWEVLPNMANARIMPSVSVLGGKIVVACGFDHGGRMQSVESFDPKTQTWDTLPDMAHLSGRVISVAHNGILHVTKWAYEDKMERFDGRKWEEVSVTDCRISSMHLVKKEHISALKSRKSSPSPQLMMTGVLAALTGLSLGVIAWWNSY